MDKELGQWIGFKIVKGLGELGKRGEGNLASILGPNFFPFVSGVEADRVFAGIRASKPAGASLGEALCGKPDPTAPPRFPPHPPQRRVRKTYCIAFRCRHSQFSRLPSDLVHALLGDAASDNYLLALRCILRRRRSG